MDKRDFTRNILQKGEEAEEEPLMSKEDMCGDSAQNHGPSPGPEGALRQNQCPQVCQGGSPPARGWPYGTRLQTDRTALLSKNLCT